MCMCSIFRGQRHQILLEQELQVAVSHSMWVLGNELCKNHAHSLSQHPYFYIFVLVKVYSVFAPPQPFSSEVSTLLFISKWKPPSLRHSLSSSVYHSVSSVFIHPPRILCDTRQAACVQEMSAEGQKTNRTGHYYKWKETAWGARYKNNYMASPSIAVQDLMGLWGFSQENQKLRQSKWNQEHSTVLASRSSYLLNLKVPFFFFFFCFIFSKRVRGGEWHKFQSFGSMS